MKSRTVKFLLPGLIIFSLVLFQYLAGVTQTIAAEQTEGVSQEQSVSEDVYANSPVQSGIIEPVKNEDDGTLSSKPPAGYVPIPAGAKTVRLKRMLMAADNADADVDTSRVLLVETSLPWSSTANGDVLTSVNLDYRSIGINDLPNTDLTDYKLIIIANDQAQAFYNKYAEVKSNLEDHVKAGGILVVGACDLGWAYGRWTDTLPGGVRIEESFDPYNYIVDGSHPIVTGIHSNNQPLTDADLYSNYCSHRTFDEASLPAGTNIILRGKQTNKPTLVEYPLGNGKVIASGLTWEHNYRYHTGNDSYGTFSRKALDDLFLYAMSNAGYNDYSSAISLSLAPNNVPIGGDLNISLDVMPFVGKRDYYFYFTGEGMERLWWDGTKWTYNMASAGRFTADQISSTSFTWKINFPPGTYTLGAALIGQGTAMSPRPEYEKSFSVNQAVDEITETGLEIGIEYEQDTVDNDAPPSLDAINISELAPYKRGQVLNLQAAASDPDDSQEELFYFWKVNKGVLKGSNINKFQSVQWVLPNNPGDYYVTAYTGDGQGKIASKTLIVNVR